MFTHEIEENEPIGKSEDTNEKLEVELPIQLQDWSNDKNC